MDSSGQCSSRKQTPEEERIRDAFDPLPPGTVIKNKSLYCAVCHIKINPEVNYTTSIDRCPICGGSLTFLTKMKGQ